LQVSNELHVLDRIRYLKLESEHKNLSEDRKKLAADYKDMKNKNSPEAKKNRGQDNVLLEALREIEADIRKCLLWRTSCNQQHALVLAGDTLFAGGNSEIVAYSANDGKKAWSAPVNGVALGIAVAHGRLLVSTDKGTIHCFRSK